MKFNALVVAAMVITSVNAGLWRSTMGCFGHSCRLRSASSQGSLDSDSDESQESEAKTNPICLAIAMQLFALWNDMGILDYRLHNPMQASHDLIENDIKKGKLRAKGMVAYSELNSEDQAKPENIEQGLVDLEQSYRQTWKELIKNKCSIESFFLLFPKEMEEQGHFPRWQDGVIRSQDESESESDVISPSKQ
ncbi:hypothetical protein BASA84_000157 [Batrachochytrium salamandrivorans]|nr:hypothetical protein BASA84_000157 [Batrachochytrium salamandrivorans]